MTSLASADSRVAEPRPAQETQVVFAVEFTSSMHHGRACHRAVQVGQFADPESARQAMAAFKKTQGGESAFAAEYLGFNVWVTDRPDALPPEMWIDFEV